MSSRIALKAAAALWMVWGIVHLMAGVLTMTQEGAAKVQGVADAVAPAELAVTYPDAALALINQHGWNLAWVGVTTMICAVFVWRAQPWAVYVAAWVGGLTDLGYFLFMDLGGFVNFVPGTVMTIVSATAIVLSLTTIRRARNEAQTSAGAARAGA